MTIDDDKFDQMLYHRITRRSLRRCRQRHRLSAGARCAGLPEGPESAPVDVILLDINMPRMNGFEFLETAIGELGEGFAKCIVVMLTTSLDPRDAERARAYTVVKDFLQKPLSTGHLHDIAWQLCA